MVILISYLVIHLPLYPCVSTFSWTSPPSTSGAFNYFLTNYSSEHLQTTTLIFFRRNYTKLFWKSSQSSEVTWNLKLNSVTVFFPFRSSQEAWVFSIHLIANQVIVIYKIFARYTEIHSFTTSKTICSIFIQFKDDLY